MSPSHGDVGPATLERIAGSLGRYNAWMFELLAPYVTGRVLEVGAGIGNISEFLVSREARGEVCLTDVSDAYLATLRRRFEGCAGVRVLEWNVENDPPAALAPGTFDTIVCLNVLEHVEEDDAALARLARLLAPDGRLVLLVPAGPILFNEFDRALGHFRRYTRRSLRGAILRAGFAPERAWFFNALGIPGWFVNGTLLRRKVLPPGQLRLFDRFVPLLRLVHRLDPPFGLSLVAVARRPRTPAAP
jgi:SAM-dependent methyltransferase